METKKVKPHLISDYELDMLNDIQENRNKAEDEFKKSAIRKGWKVLRSGWPDYLIVKDENIAFVEVKSDRDKLRENQIAILDVLSDLGLNCYIWNPTNGFKRHKKKNPLKKHK